MRMGRGRASPAHRMVPNDAAHWRNQPTATPQTPVTMALVQPATAADQLQAALVAVQPVEVARQSGERDRERREGQTEADGVRECEDAATCGRPLGEGQRQHDRAPARCTGVQPSRMPRRAAATRSRRHAAPRDATVSAWATSRGNRAPSPR